MEGGEPQRIEALDGVRPESVRPIKVIGRYALHTELATGGMATVYLGRLLGPVGFSRTVAIKRLHQQFAKDPEFTIGFLDEARLAARIRHPNVVPTLDVVALDGELFLVMEYVQGESLADLALAANKKRQPIPSAIAIAIMCGILQGLHAAHEARNERGDPLGLVHRDVSPQNILVSTDGVPRLLDFGVAKAMGRMQNSRDDKLKGKLAYMAPEQVMARPVSRQTDIFAASIVLWELLTGRRLFRGGHEADTLYNVLEAPIDPPSKYAPRLPPAIDGIVMRGLERDASKRYRTARDMAVDLEKVAPIVSAHVVSEWVQRVAGEALAHRAAQLSDVERAPTDGLRRNSQAPPAQLYSRSSETSISGVRDARSSEVSSVEGGSSHTLQRVGTKRSSLMILFGGVTILAALGTWTLLSRSKSLTSSSGRPAVSLEASTNAASAPAPPLTVSAPAALPSVEDTTPIPSASSAAPSAAAPEPSAHAPAPTVRRHAPRSQSSGAKKPAPSIYSRE